MAKNTPGALRAPKTKPAATAAAPSASAPSRAAASGEPIAVIVLHSKPFLTGYGKGTNRQDFKPGKNLISKDRHDALLAESKNYKRDIDSGHLKVTQVEAESIGKDGQPVLSERDMKRLIDEMIDPVALETISKSDTRSSIRKAAATRLGEVLEMPEGSKQSNPD